MSASSECLTRGAPPVPQDMSPPFVDQGGAPDLETQDQGEQDLGEQDAGAGDMGAPVDMAPEENVLRFLALGDTGEGNATQRQVGQAMGNVCALYGGCEFALLLGDNAYDSGVSSAMDPFFQDMFVTPYSHLSFPFYVVLGNHDLGGGGLGLDPDFRKGDYQVQYGQLNPQWLMPDKHYQVDKGLVWLLGLNTTNIFFNLAQGQKTDVRSWISQAPVGAWKIAFGHHPYISNGKHGNAGSYDGVPFLPIANGEHVKNFIEDEICGNVDLYLCGHDHSLQDLKPTCGTEFIVSGAGAKSTEIKGDNPSFFDSESTGFVMLEAREETLSVYFFDENETLLHQRVLLK